MGERGERERRVDGGRCREALVCANVRWVGDIYVNVRYRVYFFGFVDGHNGTWKEFASTEIAVEREEIEREWDVSYKK